MPGEKMTSLTITADTHVSEDAVISSKCETSHDREMERKFYPAVEYNCSSCDTRSYNLKVCSQCQIAKYCNRACQIKHWDEHRKTCQKNEVVHHDDYIKGGSFVEVSQENCEDENEKPEVYFLGLEKCVKNGHNNHSGFIGVQDFTIDHLPEVLRRSDVMEYIKAEAYMTVRVKVKYTSPNRPDSDACARHRNTRFARTASGLYVLDNPNWFKTAPCPIPNCHRTRDLGPDHLIYQGDLKIFTNKHVIYGEDELAKSTIDFFYNGNDKKGIVTEYAVQLFYLNARSDKAFIKVTIHDEDMFKKLYQLDCERSDRFRDIPQCVIDNWKPYAILISHPHGMPKKISIGKIRNITDENVTEQTMNNAKEAARLQRKWYVSFQQDDYWNFMKCLGNLDLPVFKMWYDTPSCPGSSGGQVLFGGVELEGVRGPYVANHNGYDLDTTLNYFKVTRLIPE